MTDPIDAAYAALLTRERRETDGVIWSALGITGSLGVFAFGAVLFLRSVFGPPAVVEALVPNHADQWRQIEARAAELREEVDSVLHGARHPGTTAFHNVTIGEATDAGMMRWTSSLEGRSPGTYCEVRDGVKNCTVVTAPASPSLQEHRAAVRAGIRGQR
jgi:hypothetical protein